MMEIFVSILLRVKKKKKERNDENWSRVEITEMGK